MATTNPPIVTRAAWGANPSSTPAASIVTPTPELWLHHTGSSGVRGAAGMRSLQAQARSSGLVDIAYTVVVDPDGTIFTARGVGRNSAATGGRNHISHAICVMGNFERDAATDRIVDTVASCVLWLAAQRATVSARITGPHRDAPGNATACCGRNLIARIGDINRIAAGGPGPGPAPPPPPPDTGGALLTTVVSPQRGNPQGRVPTARPIPAFGVVALENGASVEGDQGAGSGQRVLVNNDPIVVNTRALLIDIAPVAGGFVELRALPDGQIGTYVRRWRT